MKRRDLLLPGGSGVRYRDSDEVDFVIVGSGAAGGVMARELSGAGFTVVVLEQGPRLTESDFSHDEYAFWIQGHITADPRNHPQTFRRTETEKARARPNIPPAGTRWGDHYRSQIRHYYAMITGVDQQFGRFLWFLLYKEEKILGICRRFRQLTLVDAVRVAYDQRSRSLAENNLQPHHGRYARGDQVAQDISGAYGRQLVHIAHQQRSAMVRHCPQELVHQRRIDHGDLVDHQQDAVQREPDLAALGQTLEDRLAAEGPLPIGEALTIATQVGESDPRLRKG